ncbi:regulatory protein, luxR family [Variovorax sp. PDC80]|uniref:helix-turn-helix transcriptional regulator n=1 Tax=Variovorax sp. PDC80 TaxID=1882827 RepID=UPI0008ED4CB7|nr:helix-turn-helix transcriptional regulator [Variovorax sp. PDC80]SFP20890.1 regulatory protein, luxR family [Variovorax sp. PDC80]
MLEDPVLRRALDAVHHLTDPEPPWLGVLEGACGLIGGESATFIMVDAGGQMLAAQQWNVDPEAERVYREHYVQQDIITPKALGAAPGTWLDTAEFFSAGDLSGNAYYADYMLRYGMRQMLSYQIEDGPHRRGGLTLQRSRPLQRTRSHLDSERVRHFTHALQSALARRREYAEGWLATAEAAFEAFGEAMLLVNATGTVQHVSAHAAELLSHRSALRVHQGRLWHPAARARDALAATLARASAPGGAPTRLLMPADRDSLACGLQFTKAQAHLRVANEPLLLVRLHLPDRVQPLDAELLRGAFGLTPAEARVLVALVEGQTLKQHAAAQAVSINTVRTQLAALMDKMGCQRQIDLVRMALSVA